MSALTAAHAGLLACRVCGLLNRRPASGARALACSRCAAPLHRRMPASRTRTWALLIASALLYVPANTLPVTVTESPFGAQADTIMSGVVFFWITGSWPLAVLIFFASIVVPLAKIVALGALLVSVQGRSRWAPRPRTQIYRVLEFIGRWSMIDVFVVAILVALVRFDALATITAGAGAIAFGAVVVLTMLASHSFDPRLIWDSYDGR